VTANQRTVAKNVQLATSTIVHLDSLTRAIKLALPAVVTVVTETSVANSKKHVHTSNVHLELHRSRHILFVRVVVDVMQINVARTILLVTATNVHLAKSSNHLHPAPSVKELNALTTNVVKTHVPISVAMKDLI
jgi:hypothetical protein